MLDVKELTTDLAKLLADHRQRTLRLRQEAKRQAEGEAARRQVRAGGLGAMGSFCLCAALCAVLLPNARRDPLSASALRRRCSPFCRGGSSH